MDRNGPKEKRIRKTETDAGADAEGKETLPSLSL